LSKSLFNDNWYFSKQKLGTNLAEIKHWEPVAIPHDWLIYDTTKLYETGEGWYKKEFNMGSFQQGLDYVSIRFEGVYMDATVYVNQKWAGVWKYGYSTFEFDLSALLKTGKNQIVVRVVYQFPNSRWYSGAGIYRNVWLNRKHKNRIASDGVYITPIKQSEVNWLVEIETELIIQSSDSGYHLKQSILNAAGETIGIGIKEIRKGSINLKSLSQKIEVTAPNLWDIGQSHLYLLKTELYENRKKIDFAENKFGFREISFDPNQGFRINGAVTKLFGVCQHHDLGCLGAAVNKAAIKRQFEILQEMGVNAIRTAHNMPAVEFMELADEMGILICSEAFDVWETSKTTYDYARFFNEWKEKDVASWIRRDRNHPSVIMWSIGNEIYDTHATTRGQELTRNLKSLVENHDPKRHASVTMGSNYMPWENAQKCADLVKLAGYNYAETYYHDHHQQYPDWIIYGSETASTVQSRGIYRFPLKQSILADDDEQCSALGNSSTSWGAKSSEACLISDRDAKFSLGQFIWTGFDYIGEPTPYHTKNSYFGQIDTAGFKKDSFYVYQGAWTSYKTKPMVHLFPYWDYSENQLIDVRVCSNAPIVELFFNETSLGTFQINYETGQKLVGNWQLRYQKGTLRAVAYDEQGNIIAENKKTTFEDAHKLVLKPNKTEILADGQDLIFVEISAVDLHGVEVANANNRVNINVSGVGRLIGLDNGDSTDYESYKGTSRRLFSGKLLAVVAANHSIGNIIFEAKSASMESQTLVFSALNGVVPKGSSTVFPNNQTSRINEEIPIRKIELISDRGNQLNEMNRKTQVAAILHPLNTTYDQIQWRVTDQSGIDTNIARIKKLDASGRKVEVQALGDGTFYLRCMANNGSEKVQVISQLDYLITGLGQAYLNPYEFIAGGLANASNIPLTNGNERGVATARETKTHVGFKNVDFGESGADTVTLPIFSLEKGTFPIEIWEGMPDASGSDHLCTVTYTLGSIWNTYLEETYKLPRKLTGITTICFVFNRKVHLKGFSFAKPEKAYERIRVRSYTSIYGDSFKLVENGIEDIGNNVSIVFNQMDFSNRGIKKILICGHTPLPQNTIRIQFNDEINESIQLVEFKKSLTYEIQEFVLENRVGKQTVTFMFLPGCQFNFKWFKFLD